MSFQSIDSDATTPPSSLSNINLSIDTTHGDNNDASTASAAEASTGAVIDAASAEAAEAVEAAEAAEAAEAGANADAVNDANTDTQDISILLNDSKDKIIEQIKNQLLDEFKDLFQEQSVDKSLLIKILIRGMEIMETTTVKGKEQKDLVIDILIQILETDGLNVAHKDLLIQFLKEDANAFIDVIVDASRGKININKVESIVTKCIQYIFICLKKK